VRGLLLDGQAGWLGRWVSGWYISWIGDLAGMTWLGFHRGLEEVGGREGNVSGRLTPHQDAGLCWGGSVDFSSGAG